MVAGNIANKVGPRRDELLDNLRAKLRALFPSGALDAQEKRAEVLAYAAEKALGPPGVHDVAAAADPSNRDPVRSS